MLRHWLEYPCRQQSIYKGEDSGLDKTAVEEWEDGDAYQAVTRREPVRN